MLVAWREFRQREDLWPSQVLDRLAAFSSGSVLRNRSAVSGNFAKPLPPCLEVSAGCGEGMERCGGCAALVDAVSGSDRWMKRRSRTRELAARMQVAVPELLDTSGETDAVPKLYGMDAEFPNTRVYARQCLIARRMVERGVRFVELNIPMVAGYSRWDAHGGDRRDHSEYGFSVWMAGGGVRSGMSYGATDEWGCRAVENPLEMHDLHATILHQLTILNHRTEHGFCRNLTQRQWLTLIELGVSFARVADARNYMFVFVSPPAPPATFSRAALSSLSWIWSRL